MTDSLVFNSYFGGNAEDTPLSIAVDSVDGSIYVLGQSASTNLPFINSEFITPSGNNLDIFLSAFASGFRTFILSFLTLKELSYLQLCWEEVRTIFLQT